MSRFCCPGRQQNLRGKWGKAGGVMENSGGQNIPEGGKEMPNCILCHGALTKQVSLTFVSTVQRNQPEKANV